jgi:3-isopropylmalate/(R)-2-methylmalate dehydratase large subunit
MMPTDGGYSQTAADNEISNGPRKSPATPKTLSLVGCSQRAGVHVVISPSGGRSLYDKLLDAHTVRRIDDRHVLLYVDRHIINEYTSPQAFSELRNSQRRAWRPEASFAVVDHVNPTTPLRTDEIADQEAAHQVAYLGSNCAEFGIEFVGILDPNQGIEHVVVPELGIALPGMVIACGDSHTTTYGALGALGFGIGTSDVEHVLATQTIVYARLRTMRIVIEGRLSPGVTAKDVVMQVIERLGAAGATGFAVEFAGSAIEALDLSGRMTLCNMIVEAGARGALVAPDNKVFDYLKSRPRAPRGDAWSAARRSWEALRSDPDAMFERETRLNAADIEPLVSWGTSPDQVISISGRVPDPAQESDPIRRNGMQRALRYMDLEPGMPLNAVRIDRAFIGSCTNGRIEDLRSAAHILKGRKVAKHVRAMVVPGSSSVRRAAEAEGLDRIFADAGFEWRQAGCSMCLAMNNDVLAPGERCAASTNRNFEGRQGRGGRTHLMSPAMVAAAAVAGRLADVRDFPEE